MKKCNSCKETKELIEFSKNKSQKDGYNYICKSCAMIKYHQNKEKWKPKSRQYKKDNKEKYAEYSRKWRKKNPERAKEVFNKWAKENPDKVKQNNRNWAIKYKAKACEKSNRRYAKKLQAMPNWLDKKQLDEIKKIYEESARQTEETGVEYNVDHIIPLQSDLVCGLHVPWNLRIITKSENVKKGNKLIDE